MGKFFLRLRYLVGKNANFDSFRSLFFILSFKFLSFLGVVVLEFFKFFYLGSFIICKKYPIGKHSFLDFEETLQVKLTKIKKDNGWDKLFGASNHRHPPKD